MNFPETCWTILAQATLHGGDAERKALESLCRAYWMPVRECIRSRGVLEHRIDDLTQDFFLHAMENGMLRRADQKHGKFRSYLLGTLRYFLANDAAKNAALRRGGNVEHCEILEGDVTAEAEEAVFDREWAHALLEQSMSALEEEIKDRRSPEVWAVLRRYLPGGDAPETYDELMAVMNVGSGGARAEVSRIRSRYREIIRREVGRTVDSPDQIDGELSHLRNVLQASSMA